MKTYFFCAREVPSEVRRKVGRCFDFSFHFNRLLCSFSVSSNSTPILPFTVKFNTLVEKGVGNIGIERERGMEQIKYIS